MSPFSNFIKALVAAAAALLAGLALAAVDANQASQAELEAVKNIGPSLAGRLLDERKKAPFKDWNDMIDRVKGVGPGNAAKFSAQGLTVNGAAFGNAAMAPVAPVKKAPTEGKRAAGDKA